MPKQRGDLAKYILSKAVEDVNGCLNWMGTRCGKEIGERNSYGMIRVGGRMHRVTRVLWELQNGPIPNGMCILHHCDNPSCVNIDHLFAGTHQDNMTDMSVKCRWKGPKGESHPRAVLTDADVETIRFEYRRYSRVYGSKALAERYGVGHSTILRAVKGLNWKTLGE